MVRLFKGTCEAVRAMHDYHAPAGSQAKANSRNGGGGQSSSRQQQRSNNSNDNEGRHSDDDDRFPQPEGDGDGGYSYGGRSAVNVPLMTKHQVEDEGEVVFDGDEEPESRLHEDTNGTGNTELVPYAHRDLKPGNIMISDDGHRPILMDFGSTVKARIPIENRSQALLQQVSIIVDAWLVWFITFRFSLARILLRSKARWRIAHLSCSMSRLARCWMRRSIFGYALFTFYYVSLDNAPLP